MKRIITIFLGLCFIAGLLGAQNPSSLSRDYSHSSFFEDEYQDEKQMTRGEYEKFIKENDISSGEQLRPQNGFDIRQYLMNKTIFLTEDFSGNDLPVGWTTEELGDTGLGWEFMDDQAVIDSDAAGSGTHVAGVLTTPELDFSTAGAVVIALNHYYRHLGTSFAEIRVSIDSGDTWEVAYSFDATEGSADFPLFEYDISAYAAGESSVLISFLYDDGSGWQWYWQINNIVIYEPAIYPQPALIGSPLNASVDNSIYASLNWLQGGGMSPSGYRINFGTDNPPTNIENNTNLGDVTTYMADPLLTYDTEYFWQIIPYNDEGDTQEDCPVWSFATMSDPTVTAPYAQDFNNAETPALPLGWSKIVESTSDYVYVETTTLTSPNTPPNHVKMYNSADLEADLILISPPVAGDLNALAISFYAKRGSSEESVIIGTMSDPTDASTFTEYTEFVLSDIYTQYTVPLGEYEGDDSYIAFKQGNMATYNYVYFDDFELGSLFSFTMLEPIGEGTVIPAPGEYGYVEGLEANLTALPDLGYTFDSWTENVENPLHAHTSITMDDNQTVQAIFAQYDEELVWHQYGIGDISSTSYIAETGSFEVADNFSSPAIDNINKVVVHGLALNYDGSAWQQWTPGETEPFIVRFYDEDGETEPDWENPVAVEMVDAKVFRAGTVWDTHESYKFELNLSNPVNLTDGWVSVQINATDGEADGWFLWLAAEEGMGDVQAFQQGSDEPVLAHDLMLEIWGSEIEGLIPQCVELFVPGNEAEKVPINTTLQWQQSPLATGYSLYFGEALPGEGIDIGNVISYNITNLDYNTTYLWTIVPYNDEGSAEDCAVYTFTTMENTTITTFPWTETFEDDSPSRVSWSQIQEAGTANWTYATGSSSGTVNSAFQGTKNARFVSVSGTNTPITKLASPILDLSSLNGPRLIFYYAQEAWSGDQNETKVYYRVGEMDDWVEIGHYTENVSGWTSDTIDLPNPSATYQIAFEGINNYGRANVIDFVTVEQTPTTPIFSIDNEAIDFGSFAIGETSPAQTVTISNPGIGSVDVELPVLDNTDNFILGFVADDFPAALAEGESVSFTVAFEPQVAGNIPGEITVAYNDGEAKSATVALQGEGYDLTLPVFAIDTQEWDFGIIEAGTQSASKVVTISNPGEGLLQVAAPAIDNEADFDLIFLAEDFPAELATGETVSFSVVFDALSEGPKEADVTISYNDGQEGTATVALLGTGFNRPEGSTCNNPLVVELPLEDYMDNTEMYGDDYSSDGIDPNSSYLNGNDFVAQFTLDKPGMLTGSVAGSWTGLIILEECPDPVTPAARLAFAGTSTGGALNVMLEPGTYFAIVSTFPAPQSTDFTLNLSFEPYYGVSFLVTDGTDPIENASIDVTPGGTQLTDVSGVAEFLLADGEYDFAVSADGYATATGSFMVEGENVIVPEIVLLSTNEITFNVTDGVADPLIDVNLHIEGTADAGGWNIDQTFMVNGSEVLGLPNGSYTWTAQKDGYYAETDAFVVDGDGVIDISLNIFPLVTFAVEDAGGNPLAGASITIEDMEPMVTNVDGEASFRLAGGSEYNFVAETDDYYVVADMFTLADADLTIAVEMTIFPMVEFTVITMEGGVDVPLADVSIKVEELDALITGTTGEVATRLPAGNYNFNAYLIGYDIVIAAFDLVNGELTEVNITLEQAEPRFELTQEWPEGADFGLMVTGHTSEIEFEFTNTGFSDLTFSVENISINPADGMFTIKSGEGIADEWTLATGETGAITVVYTPVSGGLHTADLVFSFVEKVLVPLTGEAYEPLVLPFMDDFETNGLDQWLAVNGAQVNQWHVGTAQDDAENLSAMISNDEGVTNAYSTDDAASVVHFYMDFAIPNASSTLAFQWKGNGQAAFDFLRVSVVETSVMPQSGSALTDAHVLGSFVNQPNWRTEEITLPGAFEGKTARLVFTWRNNASNGTQPPAAIDNIMVTQTRNIDMVASVNAINVDYQTAPEDLPLPETNTITLDGEYFGETEVDLDVVWDTATPEYNSHAAGTYIFTGQVVLIPGISNADGLTVTAEVTVDKGLPVVTWPLASDIMYGDLLGESVLTDGTAMYNTDDVLGIFTFDNPEFMPLAGIYTANVTFTPGDTDNYLLVNGVTEVNVDQFPITLTANDIMKRQGLAHLFEGTEFAVEPTELIGDDEVTSATLTSDGASALAEAGFYDIVISDAAGVGIDNYAITYVNGEMEVTDKEILTLPYLLVADKVYDGTRSATVTQWGDLAGIVDDGPDVQLDFSTAVVEFSTSNVGTGITVTVSGLLLTGDDADIYRIGNQTAVADIEPKGLIVTAEDKSKIYGEDDPILTVDFDGFVANQDESVLGGSLAIERETGEDVGVYTISATGYTSVNYAIAYETGVLDITQRPIVITADAQNKIYGENDPAEFTFQITEGSIQFDDEFSGQLTREAGEDVGVYEIQQGTVALTDNYNLSYVAADLTITQRALEITADAATKVYGNDDPQFTYAITDGELMVDDELEGELDREAGEDTGAYEINVGTLTAGDNYAISLISADLTITVRPIEVTADSQAKVYGDNDPEFTYSITDGELVLDDAFEGLLDREAGEDVGSYAIEQGTLTAGINYDLTFVEALMAVTAREVTIGGSFEVADKDYDGTTEAEITDNQLVITGIAGDDAITLADLVAEFVSPEPGTDISVILSGAEISGAQAANYLLSVEGAPSTTADIFAPVFTLSIDIDPADAGSVTGEGDYEEGESVTVTAVANEGFAFNSWMTGDQEVSTDASYTFDMPAEDVTLVAKFDIIDATDDIVMGSVNIYPNPASDNFNITSGSQIRTVMIVDITGQVVYSNEVDNTEINIENSFETGVYIVRIYTKNGVFVRKLQIQK